MKQSQRWILLMIALTGCALASLAAETNTVALAVHGEVDQPLNLGLADLQAMPRLKVQVKEKDGTDASFEGVAMGEIVKRSKPRLTEKCCGNAANTCVIVKAVDN